MSESEVTNLLSKYNQIQMLVWWVNRYTKNKAASNFDGRSGEFIIKVYEDAQSTKAKTIYKIENMWVKAESIVLKEMRDITQQLLIIKEQNS